MKEFLFVVRNYWCPDRANFRSEFNKHFKEAFYYAYDTGDYSKLTMLVNAVPDKNKRFSIIRNSIKLLPLIWNQEKQTYRKDKANKTFDIKSIEHFSAIDSIMRFSADEDTVVVEGGVFTHEEFVDNILDLIVLNRYSFTAEDLIQVENALSTVKKRIIKKSKTNTGE